MSVGIAFWFREIAGWILVGLGLLVFLEALSYLSNSKWTAAILASSIAFMIYRGGMALIRIATAARLASRWLEAKEAPTTRVN